MTQWSVIFLAAGIVTLGIGWLVNRSVNGKRREEWREWRRFQAECNKQRLGVTPVEDIPAEWLRRKL